MTEKWSVTQQLETAHLTQVFSGGACNILDINGKLLRNTERDRINDWLTLQGIIFFDPQIHPETHGVEYDYDIHHKLEMAAREAAKINLYEFSPRTFGGITSLEVAADHFRFHEPVVIYFSDGNPDRDDIPKYSSKGYPIFDPYGIKDNDSAIKAHYREFIKNANNMRRYVMSFAREMTSLTINFGEPSIGDIVITPNRIHAADLFKAVVMAASGHRVFVSFTGGKNARDEKGNPVFSAPESPMEVEIQALLDQYVDEGNELRRAIAELITVNVFVRVVYTQRSATLALEEVLGAKGMLKKA